MSRDLVLKDSSSGYIAKDILESLNKTKIPNSEAYQEYMQENYTWNSAGKLCLPKGFVRSIVLLEPKNLALKFLSHFSQGKNATLAECYRSQHNH